MNKATIQKILTWTLLFLVIVLISQYWQKQQTVTPEATAGTNTITVTPIKTENASDEEVIVKLRNNSDTAITIPSSCPKNPFTVLAWNDKDFAPRTAETKINCELNPAITIEPRKDAQISYTYWNYALFSEPGRYKIQIDGGTIPGIKDTSISPEFRVVPAGFWRQLFSTAFYQPLYNILIFLITFAPGRDLGFAIILLTLLIRLILLVPSQHAIVSQRKMQELQPKLEEVKKKYEGNQEKIASETMRLWKENKVNPMSSCLPLLVQFPVLIALFYVIRSGLNPDNIHYLYGPLKNADLTAIHTNFLGILDLTKVSTFALPIIVGALQFFQLKLTMMKKKKTDDTAKEAPKSEMEMANKTMIYIMPVMIALFTASVPAGVGLYWGISTTFAIGQQVVANRKAV